MIWKQGPWRSRGAVEHATVNADFNLPVLGEFRQFITGADTTLTWVHWFNTKRLLEPIGNVPPAEF